MIDWSRKENPALAEARRGASLSAVDFAIAALGAGLITEAEAEGWVTGNAIPAVVVSALATLPEEQRVAARLRMIGPTTVRRDSPFIALLAGHIGLTDAQVDALFGIPA